MFERDDQKPEYHLLTDEDFVLELKKKLVEEVAELKDTKTDLDKELADIIEIIETLKSVLNISDEHIENCKQKKIAKAGGFEKRYFVDTVEVPDDSDWVDHYNKQPHKYPEIIEQAEYS